VLLLLGLRGRDGQLPGRVSDAGPARFDGRTALGRRKRQVIGRLQVRRAGRPITNVVPPPTCGLFLRRCVKIAAQAEYLSALIPQKQWLPWLRCERSYCCSHNLSYISGR
jgi:hypothetical protein